MNEKLLIWGNIYEAGTSRFELNDMNINFLSAFIDLC